VGKVNQDLTVKVLKATSMGTDLGACDCRFTLRSVDISEGRLTRGIDFTLVNAVVEATHRHKEIFYSDK
jgi:hypothetical protein